MAVTHLVDTSVICRLGEPAVRAVIDPLAHTGRIRRAGITDLDVGYGSRNAREWDQDMADLSVFELVETTAEHVQRARQCRDPWLPAASGVARHLTCLSPPRRSRIASCCSTTTRTST